MKKFGIVTTVLLMAVLGCSDKVQEGEILRVDSIPIKKVRVDAAVKNYLEQMGQHNPDDSIKVREQIIEGMVKNALLTLKAKKEGYTYDSTEVNRFIAMYKAQMGSDSLINKKLKEAGLTMEDWRNDVQDQSMIGKYLKVKLDSVIKAPDSTAVDSARKMMKNFEVKASHILLKVPADAAQSEVEAAAKKMEGIQKEIQSAEGKNFAAMAKKYSQDGSARYGGDLGYFKRGTMVPQFEEVAFGMAPGQVSGIVRSQFGLHLIKVEDRREIAVPEEAVQRAALNLTKSIAFDKLIEELKKEFPIVKPEESK